jgi:hypothetical protein
MREAQGKVFFFAFGGGIVLVCLRRWMFLLFLVY